MCNVFYKINMIKLVANGPGIGDAMWLSAVVEEIKRQHPDEKVRIETQFPELYIGNPVVIENENIQSPKMFIGLDHQENIHEHNVQFMCKQIGLLSPEWKNIRQYFYFIESDTSPILFNEPFITIHNTPGPWTKNKSWTFRLWEELVKKIKNETSYKIVQIGGSADLKISGVDLDLLGINLRSVCKVLNQAHRHFCCVSGSMHLASACGTPSTVIFGGREKPEITGYANNINLTSSISCSPCWKIEDCPFGKYVGNDFIKPCMQEITVDMVYNTL
jgi:ADP-heptose:LPS heptosyltransferase